jgi:hypothetical protein
MMDEDQGGNPEFHGVKIERGSGSVMAPFRVQN